MLNELIVAIIIFIIFIVGFIIDARNRRWGDDRIGSLAGTIMINNNLINPSDDKGIGKFQAINSKKVTMLSDETADICFEFIDQNGIYTYDTYNFKLVDWHVQKCSPSDLCVAV